MSPTATRRQGEQVYRHRGKIIARKASKDFVMAWQQSRPGTARSDTGSTGSTRLVALLDASSNKRETGAASGSSRKRSLRPWSASPSPTPLISNQRRSHTTVPELEPLLSFTFRRVGADGIVAGDALDRIAAAEPFIQYPESPGIQGKHQ